MCHLLKRHSEHIPLGERFIFLNISHHTFLNLGNLPDILKALYIPRLKPCLMIEPVVER
jgi:hypothetical protein